MINLKERTIELRGDKGNINCFETWWILPTGGLIHDLDLAITKAEEMGLPPNILRPVTVAMCDNGVYEPMI